MNVQKVILVCMFNLFFFTGIIPFAFAAAPKNTYKLSCGSVHSTVKEFKAYDMWIVNDYPAFVTPKWFHIYKWACVQNSQSDEYIIWWYTNNGNCDSCERWGLWSPEGKEIAEKKADWDAFNRAMQQLNLPKLTLDTYKFLNEK